MIHRALSGLEGEKCRLLKMSRLYETRPWGVQEQPSFLNAAAVALSSLEPVQLLRKLKKMERELGRIQRQRWGPREIDIDLLLYGEEVLDLPDLKIPHPEMHRRAFVLVPLAEIAGEWIHPVLGQCVRDLAQAVCDRNDIRPVT